MSDRSAPEFDALHLPPTVFEEGGVEVLRAIVIDGGLHVAIRRAFDDPDAWGMLLADVARHVGRIYAKDSALTEDQVLARVRAIFEAEMDAPTDPGTTSAVS